MKPRLSRENYLINELIQEYLQFNNYKYTSTVLTQGKLHYYTTVRQFTITLKCLKNKADLDYSLCKKDALFWLINEIINNLKEQEVSWCRLMKCIGVFILSVMI